MITTRKRSKASPAAHAAVPPGPHGQPVLGVLRELLRDNLGFMMRAARDYGDVARYRLANKTVYQVNHPEGIKRVLQDNAGNYGKGNFKVSSLDRLIGNGLVMSEGDFWLRQRRLVQPVFHRQHIAAFGEQMTSLTLEMLEGWEAAAGSRKPLDMSTEMMRLTLNIASQTLFSTRLLEDIKVLDRAFKIAAEDISFRFQMPIYPPLGVPTPRNRRVVAAIETLDRVVYRIIGERRRMLEQGRQAPSDLLNLLLKARDEDTGEGMSDKQLRDEVMTLFLAGHETTAILLTWCLYLLSKHPESERRLHKEVSEVLGDRTPTVADLPAMSYSRMVIEETLRLYPPAWITSRQAEAEDILCGYLVPTGTLTWLSPYIMHRHPNYWDNPEGFDPERFSPERSEGRPHYAYFPFGGGGHQCVGKHFALMEAQLVLATIMQHYRLDLVPGHPVEPQALVALRPRHGLPMTLHARE